MTTSATASAAYGADRAAAARAAEVRQEATGARASCLYEGFVRHRRFGTPSDELRYPLFMAYLDLDELPRLFDGSLLWSARRPALAWFRRADHLGDASTPLRESVRALVAERSDVSLDGPIRLLTHLRYAGHCFNPVSFYYCFDAAGERVRAVVAHVTNTPWRDQHSYVLALDEPAADDEAGADPDAPASRVLHGEFAKALHVSPLMGMEHSYDWRLTVPGETLSVQIDSTHADGERVFDATLALHRRELSARELRRVLARYPLLTLRLTTRIYTHALRLRLRGASWHARPQAGAA
ncbi:MAG TPA: DUF1365 domain-containing protein [Solirubrobacteraceae bacterium]|nr:DUF1365 domain-containing protein [Solirubrobacteraceae bacterium]